MTFVDLLARLAALDDSVLGGMLPLAAVGTGLSIPPGLDEVETRYALLFRTLEIEQGAVVRARSAGVARGS